MSRDRDPRRRIVAWILAVAGAFALGALLSWVLVSFASHNGSGSGSGQIALPSQIFTISGDLADPSSPGVLVPLDLSITNPYDDVLRVSGVVVTVDAVDAPRATTDLPCSTADFVVQQLDAGAALQIMPGETRSLSQLGIPEDGWPQVGMTDAESNQDGCKGATLSLEYAGTGRVDQ